MKQSIGKSYTFAAAHRILGHEGKCANLHGHTYTAEVSFSLRTSEHEGGPCTVDELGRIIDYSVIDETVGEWIKTNWDHGALLSHRDPILPILREEKSKVDVFGLQPTAECLASRFYSRVASIMALDKRFDRLILDKVIVRESPTSFAEVG